VTKTIISYALLAFLPYVLIPKYIDVALPSTTRLGLVVLALASAFWSRLTSLKGVGVGIQKQTES